MVSPVSVATFSESFISFLTFVRSICGSVVNSMAGFFGISMLFTMYFSGGNMAENSPVCGSVSM